MAFIGFVQPASGGVLTMSEIQARWWAELCRSHVKLPDKADMEQNIQDEMVILYCVLGVYLYKQELRN